MRSIVTCKFWWRSYVKRQVQQGTWSVQHHGHLVSSVQAGRYLFQLSQRPQTAAVPALACTTAVNLAGLLLRRHRISSYVSKSRTDAYPLPDSRRPPTAVLQGRLMAAIRRQPSSRLVSGMRCIELVGCVCSRPHHMLAAAPATCRLMLSSLLWAGSPFDSLIRQHVPAAISQLILRVCTCNGTGRPATAMALQ